MSRTYHFISGLPRSGSTLLSAILRQNPRVHAAMSSPVGNVFQAIFGSMGAQNEFAIFLTEAQKRAILGGVFEGYYGAMEDPRPVVFDTSRMWTARMPVLKTLFPQSKVIACVRNPAWILDSVEQLIRRNALDNSKLFHGGEAMNVYTRAEAIQRRDRMIGAAWSSLREAYFGAEADRLLLVEYDLLVKHPKDAINLIYRFIGEEPFEHDFSNVEYEAEDFDAFMNTKGLHSVRREVSYQARPTVLPPDLFKQFESLSFWNEKHPTRANRLTMQSTSQPKA